MKQCVKCGETKVLSLFNKEKRGKDGLRRECKQCRRASKREWYHNNKDKVRDYRLKNIEKYREYHRKWVKKNPDRKLELRINSKYNLSLHDYRTMLQNQKFACAICEIEFDNTQRACVDHCHDTGEVRGLLCKNCNSGIGLLGDNEQSLRKALKYVEREPNVPEIK